MMAAVAAAMAGTFLGALDRYSDGAAVTAVMAALLFGCPIVGVLACYLAVTGKNFLN